MAMTRANWIVAGAAALLLAGCFDTSTVADTGRQPTNAAQAAEARQPDRPAQTDLSRMGEQLQETLGTAAAAARDAVGETGEAIREELGRLDTRKLANAIRAVGWGFERAGQILAEAAERAAANLERHAQPEVQETASTEPETAPSR
jgi:hypothetical protein